MYDSAEIKELKRIDPIWKRLRFIRVWKLLYLAFVVFYIFYSASFFWQKQGISSLLTFFLFSFGAVLAAINQFRQERYWKRIELRRLEALDNMQPFVASGQPGPERNALSLPVTIRLRWNRAILVVAGVFILLVMGLTLAAVLVASPRNSVQSGLVIIGIVTLLLVICTLLGYFLLIRYQTQEIELTESGIKTRYMGQERSLHWDETRIFAEYDALGMRKSLFAHTYELSDERMVVRWGEQSRANPFLSVESNLKKPQDFNWLLGQINALVAARTGLPLLDLSDRP